MVQPGLPMQRSVSNCHSFIELSGLSGQTPAPPAAPRSSRHLPWLFLRPLLIGVARTDGPPIRVSQPPVAELEQHGLRPAREAKDPVLMAIRASPVVNDSRRHGISLGAGAVVMYRLRPSESSAYSRSPLYSRAYLAQQSRHHERRYGMASLRSPNSMTGLDCRQRWHCLRSQPSSASHSRRGVCLPHLRQTWLRGGSASGSSRRQS
jgi:hypothetical protein